MSEKQTSSGPLYKIPPTDGYYKWECPICNSICYDLETRRDTCCQNGHVVKLAVVGTVHDGYSMTVKTTGEVS